MRRQVPAMDACLFFCIRRGSTFWLFIFLAKDEKRL